MFILYAVLAGLVIGAVSGGSVARLGDLRFSWAPLIAIGMVVQLLLFSTTVGDALGVAAPVVYVASNLAVLAAVWKNRTIPGLPLVLVGGAANLVAICANGGYMPVSADALAALGRLPREGYVNSRFLDGVVLGPLTDLFAMPAWMPMANIFSVGDVLIGVGAAMAVVAAMHGRAPMVDRDDEGRSGRTGLTGRPVRWCTDPSGGHVGTTDAWPGWSVARTVDLEAMFASVDRRPGQTRRETGTQSQGSSSEDRPVAGGHRGTHNHRGGVVKANLARFTMALSLLATMALTLAAGLKWH